MSGETELERAVEREAKRLRRAERDRGGLLALTGYLGTLALLFLIPVVGGAYLGLWLDERASAFSSRWTVSLILAGVALGALNVILYIREHG